MDNRILAKFYNYINVADKSKALYPKIYYYIKTYKFFISSFIFKIHLNYFVNFYLQNSNYYKIKIFI